MFDREKPPESIDEGFRWDEYGKRRKRIRCLGTSNMVNKCGFEMRMKPAGDNSEHLMLNETC